MTPKMENYYKFDDRFGKGFGGTVKSELDAYKLAFEYRNADDISINEVSSGWVIIVTIENHVG